MREEVEWWISAAHRDGEMADVLLSRGFFEGAAFHSQQAAEKYLKALCIFRKAAWLRTHSCTATLEAVKAQGQTVPDPVMTAARKLDAHYIAARYPNGVGGAPEAFYDQAIAEDCTHTSRLVKEYALGIIGEQR
ncbi:MAG: HEPN domain-containing protein [Bacillota bacterium]|nr:HEPN domain-containing protein [Bacillota bacterium]